MNKILLIIVSFCLSFSSLVALPDEDLYREHIRVCLNAFEKLENRQLENKDAIKHLCDNIYELEKAYPEYVQCLTAQPSNFYIYQVVAEKLLEKMSNQKRDTFVWLRSPMDSLFTCHEELFSTYPFLLSYQKMLKELSILNPNLYEDFENINLEDEELYRLQVNGEEWTAPEPQKMTEEMEKMFEVNDTHPEIGKQLISVNFSMETYHLLDSAVWFFLSNSASTGNNLETFLRNLFDSFQIDKNSYEPLIKELIAKSPDSQVGLINQIFIPKEKVEHYLYFSQAGGFRDFDFFSFEKKYETFQRSRELQEFRTYRNFQARLLAGCVFKDPTILIYRHTLFPLEEQLIYEQFVQEKINQLFQ